MKTLQIERQENKASSLEMLRPFFAQKLALRLQDGIKIIEHNNILFCRSDSNYTEFHLLDGRKIIASKPLKHIEAHLPLNFIRIHQSYLVNLNMVSFISNEMELINGSVLPISRSHKKEMTNLLKRNIKFI